MNFANGFTRFPLAAAGLLLSLLPQISQAHNPLTATERDPALLLAALLLAVMWLTHLLGQRRVRSSFWEFVAFQAAMLLAIAAMFGPLDDWAETDTAAHMVQHMLMMVVIAPLWVIARPLPQWHAVQPMVSRRLFAPLLRCSGYPMLAAAIHGVVIWFWHAPRLYLLALHNPWWHALEHVCFLLSAGVFWWSVLRTQNNATPKAGLALLFTLMHTGFLGALLTFAPVPLYGAERTLASQQLAGLLMWVMGGLPYFAAAVWIGWRWFNRATRYSGA